MTPYLQYSIAYLAAIPFAIFALYIKIKPWQHILPKHPKLGIPSPRLSCEERADARHREWRAYEDHKVATMMCWIWGILWIPGIILVSIMGLYRAIGFLSGNAFQCAAMLFESLAKKLTEPK